MNRNLLIADDDPAMRALARECLTGLDTVCIEADDGVTAVRLAAERKPDALLLDFEMPRMDGFEVCRRLKADPRTSRIPILFVTSNDDQVDRAHGIDIGAVDYITKPFYPDELRARVKSVLRGRMELDRAEGLAARDGETGLLNRSYLEQRLEADLAASRRHGHPLACCIASIDGAEGSHGFEPRPANRNLMHAAARGLLSVLRREDVACRYGPNSLAVLGFVSNQSSAIDLGHRVRQAIATAATVIGRPDLVVSVGLALSHYSIGDTLLWHAAEAMRHAVDTAPGTVQFGGELTELHLTDRPLN
jgi:diguanylate cyclase (GGDEF)-like protein